MFRYFVYQLDSDAEKLCAIFANEKFAHDFAELEANRTHSKFVVKVGSLDDNINSRKEL